MASAAALMIGAITRPAAGLCPNVVRTEPGPYQVFSAKLDRTVNVFHETTPHPKCATCMMLVT
jgi:hypothetical protein